MKKIIISSVCVMMLCACGMSKKDLGLEKETPNEMMVVSRPPLSIPPSFGLRPVVAESPLPEAELSTGEEMLLQKMK